MKYAVLDIEASGGKKGEEKIIDIAIYQFDGTAITDQFGSMVNPEKSIDKYVQKLTGITDKMVRRAPKFYELAKRVVEITEGCIIVGHGVSFDYRMLRQEFASLGFTFQRDTLDTLVLAQKLIPNEESYSLGKLCKSLGIPLNNRHRAQGDTLATLELFKLLLQKDSAKNIIEEHAQTDINSKQIVNKLLKLQRDLPSVTGVYYYHDYKGKIFFLNASKNIAIDVNNDFTSDKNKYQSIQSRVNQVSYDTTGSFLIATLKYQQESKLHKKSISLINKQASFKYGLYITQQEDGRKVLEINKINTTQKKPLLVFMSKSKAFKELKVLEREVNLNGEDNVSNNNRKINRLRNSINVDDRLKNFALIDKGRTKQEKSFLWVEDKKIKGYGFFSLYKQFEDKKVRNKLTINIKQNIYTKAIINSFIRFNKSIKIITLEENQ